MYSSNGTARAGPGYGQQRQQHHHRQQQQPPQDEKRGRARNRPFDRNAPPPDRMYNQVRMAGSNFVTTGPAIPYHVDKHSCGTAMKMAEGKFEKRPTFVLGLRATDESMVKPSSRVVRGFVETLRDDTVDLLDYWRKTDRSAVCNAMSIFQLVKDNYELEEGRPWTVWAFRDMWDQQPVVLKTVEDSLEFLENRLDQLAMPDPNADASDYSREAGRMIMHFVVEVSPTWPKLFEVTYHSDDEEEEVVDEEELQTRTRVEQRRLAWERMAEERKQKEEVTSATVKQTKHESMGRIDKVTKAMVKLSIGKRGPEKPERVETTQKETGTKESAPKVSESRCEREKKEADRKETERKAKERERRKEREAREERERERKEKEEARDRARQRRREREETERKEVERQLRDDRLRREKERERRREREIQEEREKRDRRERERQRDKDRLRERTSEKKVLICSHGQFTVGTSTTTSSRPFLRAFLRGHA